MHGGIPDLLLRGGSRGGHHLSALAYTSGLRELPASTAGVLALLDPLTAALLGIALFGEHLSAAGVAGAALIVSGLALLARRT